jgi:hypothetical protein
VDFNNRCWEAHEKELMIFAAEEYDAGASLHVIKRQHTQRAFNGRREAQPSHFFQNLKIVLNDCKAGRAKSHACTQALDKGCLK